LYHLRRDHAIGSGSNSWGLPKQFGLFPELPLRGQKASLPVKAVRLQICQGSNRSRERRLSNPRQTWPDIQRTGENTTAPCNNPLAQMFRSSQLSICLGQSDGNDWSDAFLQPHLGLHCIAVRLSFTSRGACRMTAASTLKVELTFQSVVQLKTPEMKTEPSDLPCTTIL